MSRNTYVCSPPLQRFAFRPLIEFVNLQMMAHKVSTFSPFGWFTFLAREVHEDHSPVVQLLASLTHKHRSMCANLYFAITRHQATYSTRMAIKRRCKRVLV